MNTISNLYNTSVDLIISPPKIQYFQNDLPHKEMVQNHESKLIPF